MTAVVTAVATLERLLARGELSASVLADLQKLFEDEANHPVALISIQGNRAAVEKRFEACTPAAPASRLFLNLHRAASQPSFLRGARSVKTRRFTSLIRRGWSSSPSGRLPNKGPHWNSMLIVFRVRTGA